MAGVLYIVATPIGNLEDITLRALRVLKEVDLIAAEDTRHTRHLLDHYGIKTALTSYHEHNERAKAQNLVERLLRGDNIALVSDAGTPAISDPGYRLVVAALPAGIQVTPIPGAAALAAVISASGLPSDRFVFEGFLPAKKQEKKKKLQKLQSEVRTLIFYEAPHRLKESLQDLLQVFGDREIVVAREVTKMHEEFLRGTISAVSEQIANREVEGRAHDRRAWLRRPSLRFPTKRSRRRFVVLPAQGWVLKQFPNCSANVTIFPSVRSIGWR